MDAESVWRSSVEGRQMRTTMGEYHRAFCELMQEVPLVMNLVVMIWSEEENKKRANLPHLPLSEIQIDDGAAQAAMSLLTGFGSEVINLAILTGFYIYCVVGCGVKMPGDEVLFLKADQPKSAHQTARNNARMWIDERKVKVEWDRLGQWKRNPKIAKSKATGWKVEWPAYAEDVAPLDGRFWTRYQRMVSLNSVARPAAKTYATATRMHLARNFISRLSDYTYFHLKLDPDVRRAFPKSAQIRNISNIAIGMIRGDPNVEFPEGLDQQICKKARDSVLGALDEGGVLLRGVHGPLEGMGADDLTSAELVKRLVEESKQAEPFASPEKYVMFFYAFLLYFDGTSDHYYDDEVDTAATKSYVRREVSTIVNTVKEDQQEECIPPKGGRLPPTKRRWKDLNKCEKGVVMAFCRNSMNAVDNFNFWDENVAAHVRLILGPRHLQAFKDLIVSVRRQLRMGLFKPKKYEGMKGGKIFSLLPLHGYGNRYFEIGAIKQLTTLMRQTRNPNLVKLAGQIEHHKDNKTAIDAYNLIFKMDRLHVKLESNIDPSERKIIRRLAGVFKTNGVTVDVLFLVARPKSLSLIADLKTRDDGAVKKYGLSWSKLTKKQKETKSMQEVQASFQKRRKDALEKENKMRWAKIKDIITDVENPARVLALDPGENEVFVAVDQSRDSRIDFEDGVMAELIRKEQSKGMGTWKWSKGEWLKNTGVLNKRAKLQYIKRNNQHIFEGEDEAPSLKTASSVKLIDAIKYRLEHFVSFNKVYGSPMDALNFKTYLQKQRAGVELVRTFTGGSKKYGLSPEALLMTRTLPPETPFTMNKQLAMRRMHAQRQKEEERLSQRKRIAQVKNAETPRPRGELKKIQKTMERKELRLLEGTPSDQQEPKPLNKERREHAYQKGDPHDTLASVARPAVVFMGSGKWGGMRGSITGPKKWVQETLHQAEAQMPGWFYAQDVDEYLTSQVDSSLQSSRVEWVFEPIHTPRP
ncbi:hypothetical protein HK102_005177 [Quaeritorhiza haematococci]|nr:hypothetical protein HK102_005177 [Quaeritorhiza haematococci]